MTGLSPTDIENTWHLGDVNWVLLVSHAREIALVQIATNNKCSINEVRVPYSVHLRAEEQTKRKRKPRQLKKDGNPDN